MIDYVERSLLVALCKKMFDKNEVDDIMGQVEEGLKNMDNGANEQDAKIISNMYRNMLTA